MGVDKADLKPQYTCQKCKDMGYINGKDCDCLKAEINACIKELTPPQKTVMKKKLTDANLPTAFKAVNDIDVLNRVLEIIKA